MREEQLSFSEDGWTIDDQTTAWVFGWGVFAIEGGKFEIQRLDDPNSITDLLDDCPPKLLDPIFDSDEQARAFVLVQANIGNRLAKRALSFVGYGK